MKKEIEKIIDAFMPCNCADDYKKRGLIAPDCPNHNYKEDLTAVLLALFEERERGQALFNDLAHRLIKHILEFNPGEHDIELNLVGIILKAKQHAIATSIKG